MTRDSKGMSLASYIGLIGKSPVEIDRMINGRTECREYRVMSSLSYFLLYRVMPHPDDRRLSDPDAPVLPGIPHWVILRQPLASVTVIYAKPCDKEGTHSFAQFLPTAWELMIRDLASFAAVGDQP